MPYKLNPITGKLDYYETGSGDDLAQVLINGNSAGSNNVDLNFQDLLNT